MNPNIVISVVVPIYNAQRYLHRCVESVLCQMNECIELILVNDGSTDGSADICDAYASNHEGVVVIHKENGGLSTARNAGMRVAQGEYISFLDADDYVDSNLYDQLIPILREYSPDCLDFGWRYVSAHGVSAPNYHGVKKNCLLSRETICNTILPPLLNIIKDDDHFIFPYAWNKIYKGSILRGNKLFFDDALRTWEDRPFLVHFLKYCNTFYSIDGCYYNYVGVPDSLSSKYDLAFFKIILSTYDHYTVLYGNNYDFKSQYAINYWSHAIEGMIFRALEQRDRCDEIRQSILDTLANEQVVYWFTRRVPENGFEAKVGKLVVSRETEKALQCYKAKALRRNRGERLRKIKLRVRHTLAKVIGK